MILSVIHLIHPNYVSFFCLVFMSLLLPFLKLRYHGERHSHGAMFICVPFLTFSFKKREKWQSLLPWLSQRCWNLEITKVKPWVSPSPCTVMKILFYFILFIYLFCLRNTGGWSTLVATLPPMFSIWSF